MRDIPGTLQYSIMGLLILLAYECEHPTVVLGRIDAYGASSIPQSQQLISGKLKYYPPYLINYVLKAPNRGYIKWQ